jgi:hypothetical protein
MGVRESQQRRADALDVCGLLDTDKEWKGGGWLGGRGGDRDRVERRSFRAWRPRSSEELEGAVERRGATSREAAERAASVSAERRRAAQWRRREGRGTSK